MTLEIYKNGTRMSREYKVNLPQLIGFNPNLMAFPTSVLSNKAAVQTKKLEVKWTTKAGLHSYVFSADRDHLLPLCEHAKGLDAALALFAYNINDEGRLYFRYRDIAEILEQKNTSGFRSSFAEGIYRYMHCSAKWTNAYLGYKAANSFLETKVSNRGDAKCIIVKSSSMWCNDKNISEKQKITLNPKNKQDSDSWNFIDLK